MILFTPEIYGNKRFPIPDSWFLSDFQNSLHMPQSLEVMACGKKKEEKTAAKYIQDSQLRNTTLATFHNR